MPDTFSHENALWVYLIIATSLIVTLIAVFCLSHGINEIFPYFFLVPVLLGAYAMPHRGVLITVALGWVYIILVYVFGAFSAQIIAIHTAWFFIFISLGIAISHFAESSRKSRDEIEQLKKEAFGRIEHNMEQFAILNDQIKNPLQVILMNIAMIDEETRALVSEQVHIIKEILHKLDTGFLESETVRKFLRDHYGFGKK